MRSELDEAQIKKQLQDAQKEIARRLGIRDEVNIENAADEMDQVQAAEARELAISNLDRSARWLRQVEAALRKLDAGEYGICESCEEPIGVRRLRAVPWAQLCIKCQEIADRNARQGQAGDGIEVHLNAA